MQAVCLGKTDAAIPTRAYRLTVGSLLFIFVVHWTGVKRATYLCLDCTKNVQKNWNVNGSFIIYVNFDYTWNKLYPVSLTHWLSAHYAWFPHGRSHMLILILVRMEVKILVVINKNSECGQSKVQHFHT